MKKECFFGLCGQFTGADTMVTSCNVLDFFYIGLFFLFQEFGTEHEFEYGTEGWSLEWGMGRSMGRSMLGMGKVGVSYLIGKIKAG